MAMSVLKIIAKILLALLSVVVALLIAQLQLQVFLRFDDLQLILIRVSKLAFRNLLAQGIFLHLLEPQLDLAVADHLLRRSLLVHNQVHGQVRELLRHDDLELSLQEVIVGLVHDDERLLLARAHLGNFGAHLMIYVLLDVPIHVSTHSIANSVF